jgi:ribonuclease G
MPREILINIEPRQASVAILNNGQLEEFYIEQPQEKTAVGNIYKGRIEAIVPSLNAAFVDIGFEKKSFLYLSRDERESEVVEGRPVAKPPELKKGQEVLVQVVKEAFGTKGARISTEISLPGRYLVLMRSEERRVGKECSQ